MIYSIKIESFVFNEEENEEEDEAAAKRANDFDEELVDSSIESQLKKDSYYCGAMKKEDFMDSDASIDSDTRVKLEALLSNAGIDSITSDLLKDPQIMHTLTTGGSAFLRLKPLLGLCTSNACACNQQSAPFPMR